uniref:Alternative protein LIN9 n=1 Tax=Homo sapiens TaxID=9606 RepID=L8E9Q2_HUMAN|nr:alternative protein LIN9 [Homo sapiens]
MCMNSPQHMQTTAAMESMKKPGLFIHVGGSVEIPSRKLQLHLI